jgi:hypothetical protein
MKVVAQQSEAERDRHFAEREVEGALVALAANLLRVVRGAGKPVEIAPQALRYVQAAQAYFDLTRTWPSRDLHGFLDIGNPRLDRFNAENRRWEEAMDTMVKGALQMAASRLLGQLTQESAGQSQLHDGIKLREEAIERQWKSEAKITSGSGRSRSRGGRPRANTFD